MKYYYPEEHQTYNVYFRVGSEWYRRVPSYLQESGFEVITQNIVQVEQGKYYFGPLDLNGHMYHRVTHTALIEFDPDPEVKAKIKDFITKKVFGL